MALYTRRDKAELALRLLLLSLLLAALVAAIYPAYSPHSVSNSIHYRSGYEQALFWSIIQLGVLILHAKAWGTATVGWRRHGHCGRCDYDLRASIPAGSETCPECGEPIHPDAGIPLPPPPKWSAVAVVLLISIPLISFLAMLAMAFVPVPYEPMADPARYVVVVPHWPHRFNVHLVEQLVFRYALVNLAILTFGIAMIFGLAPRRPGLCVLVMPLTSVLLFLLFVYGLLPAIR